MRQRRKNDGGVVSSANEEPNLYREEEKISSNAKRVFALCFAFRIVNALLIQTYFNPDEHWQALEVAHRLAFGYGHLTWEWEKGIRSYLHPLLFALLYKVPALLGLDTPWFMIKAPRLLQSIFSAVGDLYLYKPSRVLFGHCVAKWAKAQKNLSRMMYLTLLQLFSQLTNWFMFFCFNRTLSNSLQTVLTLVSLFYWPCMRISSSNVPLGSRKWGLAVAALACLIRPTSAITWVYVGLCELYLTQGRLKFILLEVIPMGVLVLGFTCLLDCLMYGSWVLVPLNFLKFDFLSSGGDYYGAHKWHWYFTQGFLIMVFTFLPFSIAGIIKTNYWNLSGLVAWVLGPYSVLGQKNSGLIFSGYSLATLQERDSSKVKGKDLQTLTVNGLQKDAYSCKLRQRGTEDVMNYLSKEAMTESGKYTFPNALPCHTLLPHSAS